MNWATICVVLVSAAHALPHGLASEGRIAQAVVSVDALRRSDIAAAHAVYLWPSGPVIPDGFLVEPPRRQVSPGCTLNASATDALISLLRSAPTAHPAQSDRAGSIVVYLTTKSNVQHEIAFSSASSENPAEKAKVMVVVDGIARFYRADVVNRFIRKLRTSGCGGFGLF